MSELNDVNRRFYERPEHKKASGKLFYRLLMDKTGKRIFEMPLGTTIFICLLIIEIVVIYWSLVFRLPELDNNLILLTDKMQLETKLEDQKQGWSETEYSQIEKNIAQAESMIFESLPMLATWLSEKNSFAKKLGLEMTYSTKNISKIELKNTFSLFLEINLSVAQEIREQSYNRVLKFTRSIIDEKRHLEILGNEVKSAGDGIQFFSLNMSVWVKDPNHILNASISSKESFAVEGADVPFVQ